VKRCYQVETINLLSAFTPLLPVGSTGVDSLFTMIGSVRQCEVRRGANGATLIESGSPVFNVFGPICFNLRMLYTGLARKEGPGALWGVRFGGRDL